MQSTLIEKRVVTDAYPKNFSICLIDDDDYDAGYNYIIQPYMHTWEIVTLLLTMYQRPPWAHRTLDPT